MPYRELIKNFEGIRTLMRDIYVNGFRGREDVYSMSKRSYDDDVRRIRNWLDGYTASYYTETGKKAYLLIDSRLGEPNPLYRIFRAKSFTNLDITLHFCLMDLLAEGAKTASECTEVFCERYLEDDRFPFPDEGTVRNKLREYAALGILTSEKQGKKLVYALAPMTVDRDSWRDAVDLFSESAPLGVIGSYFGGEHPSLFRFKHRYLLSALDSEVMLSIFQCMREKRMAELTILSRSGKKRIAMICPVRLYLSVQTGRQYLLGARSQNGQLVFTRLDTIRSVRADAPIRHPEALEAAWKEFSRHQWGVSSGGPDLERLTMVIYAAPWEGHIVQRLQREKRIGQVTQLDKFRWKFEAQVWNAGEMLNWVRTFIGRIESFECTNPDVMERYRNDLYAMAEMYGGGDDAVQ